MVIACCVGHQLLRTQLAAFITPSCLTYLRYILWSLFLQHIVSVRFCAFVRKTIRWDSRERTAKMRPVIPKQVRMCLIAPRSHSGGFFSVRAHRIFSQSMRLHHHYRHYRHRRHKRLIIQFFVVVGEKPNPRIGGQGDGNIGQKFMFRLVRSNARCSCVECQRTKK